MVILKFQTKIINNNIWFELNVRDNLKFYLKNKLLIKISVENKIK